MAPCIAMTKAGKPCSKNACEGTEYCSIHKMVGNDMAAPEEDIMRNIVEPVKKVLPPVRPPPVDPAFMVHEDGHIQHEIERLVEQKKEIQGRIKKLRALAKTSSQDRIKNKAKQLFYHDNKDDAAIIQYIKDNGRHATRTKVVKSQLVEVDVIPWMFKKILTDNKYDALSEQEKEPYMIRAREALADKILRA